MKELIAQLAVIRAEGVAYDDEEVYEGLVCMAAPVRDYSGRAVASFSVSVPKLRMTPLRKTFCKEALLESTAELTAKLSHH